jgi:hypothetical protein
LPETNALGASRPGHIQLHANGIETFGRIETGVSETGGSHTPPGANGAATGKIETGSKRIRRKRDPPLRVVNFA